VSLAGTVTLNDGDADGISVNANATRDPNALNSPGAILIEARGAASDVVINADIVTSNGNATGRGHITVLADDDVRINADLRTDGTAGNNEGSVQIVATNRTVNGAGSDGVIMNNNTSITTHAGVIRIVADNESDIQLGRLDTVNANFNAGAVSLIAERSILDGQGDLNDLNIQTGTLRMVADAAISNNANLNGQIGTADTTNVNPDANVNAIDIQVTTLAAQSADGIYLSEADGLTVNATGNLTVQEVNFNSTTTTRTDVSLSDLTTTDNGPIKLVSLAGTVTLNDGDADNETLSAKGTGDVLIRTLAADGDIVINGNGDPAQIISNGGHITLVAGDDIDLNANVQTRFTGTVYLLASNRSSDSISGVDMQSGTSILTGGGNVRLVADNEADILLSSINTRSGHVSLIAERSILDNNGAAINVTADALRMIADANVNANGTVTGLTEDRTGTIGTASDLIDTTINLLAAQSASGIFVAESNTLVTGTVADVSIQQVNFNSLLSERTDPRLGGVTTENNSGIIQIDVELGSLTVNQGTQSITGAGKVIATGILAKGDRSLIHLTATENIVVNSSVIASLDKIGVVDNRDADLDSDGILDQVDDDLDNDGKINSIDTDDDGDGQLDAVDLTPLGEGRSSGEVITFTSATGNIDISSGVTISTDEDWSNKTSSDTTADRIKIVANSDKKIILDANKQQTNGKVSFGENVTLRTDGGIAKHWSLRPLPARETGTAFFEFGTGQVDDRIAGTLQTQGTNYLGVFNLIIGVAGEENLRMDIDWRDASNDTPGADSGVDPNVDQAYNGNRANVTSNRYQLIRLHHNPTDGLGKPEFYQIAHRWSLSEVGKMMNDFKDDFPNREIVVDFSVAHHESINVQGDFVRQAGPGAADEVIPGRQISSTDVVTETQNPLTGLLPEGINRTDNELLLNSDLQFENGVAFFTVPAPAPKGILAQTVDPLLIPAQVLVRDQPVIITNPVVAQEQNYAAAAQVTGTEVYFRMTQTLPDGTEVPIGSDIKSEAFSSPDALDALIRSNNLPDGTGYEVKLILETGGKTIERSVLEFDITGGQPQVTGSGDADLEELKLERRPDFRLEPDPQQQEVPAGNDSVDTEGSTNPVAGLPDVVPVELIKGTDSQAASSEPVPVIVPLLEVPAQANESVEDGITMTESAVNGSVAFGMITSLQLAKSRRRQRESEFGMSKAARLSRRLSGLMSEAQDEAQTEL
jgi:hypothetical protein